MAQQMLIIYLTLILLSVGDNGWPPDIKDDNGMDGEYSFGIQKIKS